MIETLRAPVETKSVLFFDYSNLIKFLDFIETSNYKAHEDIHSLQVRIRSLDDVELNIKEIFHRIERFNHTFEEVNRSLNHHSEKLMDLEVKAKTHIEQIIKLEDDNHITKKRLISLEEKTNNINRVVESHSLKFENQNTQINSIKDSVEVQKSLIDNHESELIKQNEEINKLKNLEEQVNALSEKTRYKFKKNKTHFENITTKQGNRIKQIELVLGQSLRNGNETLNDNDFPITKQLDLGQFKSLETTQVINDRNRTKDYEILKKQYNELNEKIKGTIDSHEEEIKNLKSNIINMNFNEKSPIKLENLLDEQNKFIIEEEIDPSMYSSKMKEIITKMSELEISNQKIFTLLLRKCEKEDLLKFEKVLNLEVDKMNKKINAKNLFNNETSSAKEIKEEDIEVINEYIQHKLKDKLLHPDDIKKIFIKMIKENELIKQINTKISFNSDEINKLYDSLIDVRRVLTDQLSFHKLIDMNELPIRLCEIESEISNLKEKMEEVRKDFLTDEIHNDPIKNEKIVANFKEYVRVLANGMKISTERIENLQTKVDSLNHEILLKIKKDLGIESNRILEEFRVNLKSSLNKIEGLLNDKVDRFNFEEFSKKLDVKIFQEISKKLDKKELNKNTHLITKKIDQLENRISRTLVDTLIDIQVDEAPLIMKKGLQGERCASCSQQIPNANCVNNSSNINISLHNESVNGKLIQSSSVHNFNYKKNQKDSKAPLADTIEENIISSKLSKRSNVTHSNFHLPNINKSSILKKNIKKTCEDNINSSDKITPRINQKSVNFNNSQNNFGIVQEDNSEKQINNIINSELDKKAINHDNIMRSTKRVYDNIEKKNK